MFFITHLKTHESKKNIDALQIYFKNLRTRSHEKRVHKISGQNAL